MNVDSPNHNPEAYKQVMKENTEWFRKVFDMDGYSLELVTVGEKNTTFKVDGKEDGQAYLSPFNKDEKFGLVLLQEWWGLNKCNYRSPHCAPRAREEGGAIRLSEYRRSPLPGGNPVV